MTTPDPINHAAPLSSQRIIRSAMVVMFGFFFTKLVSLGQVFIIAERFGASKEYDTYVLANSVPEQIIKLIGVGALSVAFIPVFSGLLNRRDSVQAWRLASQLFNSLLMITLGISLLVVLIAPWLVEYVIAPGFSASQIEQTAELMRILLLTTVIFSLSSLITGVLNSHNHFFLTVLAPIFFDFGLLFGVIFLTESMGVYGLAWGTVLGAGLHFIIQLPGLIMFKAKWHLTFGWREPQLRQVIKIMIPRIIASFIFTINFVVYGNIASRLGEGAASSFSWGIRIMDIPEALIGTALGSVIFPTLAALTELGEVAERRKLFSQAVRFILLATIPSAAGMIVLGKPAISALFTDPEELNWVYAVVVVMAFAMIFQSVHEVVARAFYAQKDTVMPLIAGTIAMILSVTTVIVLYQVYKNTEFIPFASPFGVGITAIGYLVAFVAELGILMVVLRRRWEDIDGQRIQQTLQRTLAATLFMAIPVALIDYGLTQSIFTEGGRVEGILRTGIGSAIGGGLFLVGALLFNIEEVKQIPSLIRRRKKDDATLAAA